MRGWIILVLARYGPVACFCEHDYELKCFIKDGESVDAGLAWTLFSFPHSSSVSTCPAFNETD